MKDRRLDLFRAFILTFIIGTNVLAQEKLLPKQYYFHRLNESHGLTNNVINDIAQDTIGYTWVGTEDGLFRFNGSEFQAFRHAMDSSSVPNNLIKKVFTDRSNQVWVLTDFGLARYDYQSDQINQLFPHIDLNNNSLKSFSDVVELDNGDLIFGVFGGNLLYYRNGKFEPIDFANELQMVSLDYLNVMCMTLVHDKLWIGTWYQGVIQIDLNKKIAKHLTLESLEANDDLVAFSILNDASGNIWLGTNKGLYIFEAGGFDWIKISDTTVNGFPNDEILDIYEDNSGTIWLGTRKSGLISINNETPKITPSDLEVKYFPPGKSTNHVSHRTISKIFQDQHKNIWLGTHNDGINVFDPAGENITLIDDENSQLESMDLKSIWGIAEAADGAIWMGTDGNGLFKYDPYGQKMEKFAGSGTNLELTDQAILAIAPKNDNEVWLGTYGGGLNIINPIERSVKSINTDSEPSFLSNDVRFILHMQDDRTWFSTNRGGLYLYSKGKVSLIADSEGMDIRAMSLDEKRDCIWMATYGDGLAKFNYLDNSFEYFNWFDNGLNYTPIGLSLTEVDGNIWVGTKQNGVAIFNPLAKEFKFIDESNGLLNNAVRGLVHDQNGFVWASTNLGLSAIDLSDHSVRNFDSSDGLQRGQFNDGSAFLSKNGYLVFGGIYGGNIFYPSDLLQEQELPQITFTALTILNEKVKPNIKEGAISQSMPIEDLIVLTHDMDVFSIEFEVLSFPHSEGWKYEYRLKGFEKKWNQHAHTRSATYRALKSGDYTFQARVVDQKGLRKGAVSTIQLKVLPPWWFTWWAYAVYVVLGATIIILLYRYNNQQIKLRQTLFYEKKLRQQEHDSMQEKIRFYTNFSHEMRTPITLVMGPINDLLRSDQVSSIHKKALNLANKNAHLLLKLVNRLLEFRKLETETTVVHVGDHDIAILAQEEAESFTFLAKERGIKFGFYCETELHAWVDLEKLQIIINNLLSNALKYSESGQKVTFGVFHEADAVHIEVKDQGRGISEKEQQLIFTPFYQADNSIGTGGTGIGLALCKSFVELHGGRVYVKSELDQGTEFHVIIPTGKEHFEGKENVRFVEVIEGEVEEHIALYQQDISESDFESIENEKVLMVVDDNKDIREYVSSLFQEQFRVISLENGKQALEEARENGPDIIITDVMMPEMDGLTFCKEIKGNLATSHIPVILLTAKGAKQTKVDGYEVGADGYITKPFDSEVLIARVNNLLQNRDHLRGLHENGEWMDNKNVASSEIEFVQKVEAAVLDLIPTGELNVISLCKELGFSRTSLYRKIKSLTDQSIKQFIRSIKLKKAAEMLAHEDMAVSEIAFSLDFTDLKHFRTCFKKQFGQLPSEYQNERKNDAPIDQEEIKKALNI
ncbi:response regulator [Reichenbachiella sp.]